MKPSAVSPVEHIACDHIEPGIYAGYCREAVIYYDRGFRQHTCRLLFDVFGRDGMTRIATVPVWLNLGKREKPYAPRRGKYFQWWVEANGGKAPTRADRMTPGLFQKRMATIIVADNKGTPPYSIVTSVKSWDTGQGTLLGMREGEELFVGRVS